MRYGYHYSPCSTATSGPGLWLLLKLAAFAGALAGIWWVLTAIGRAATAAASAMAGAASAAGPVMLGAVGAIGVLFAFAVVMVVVRNNQRPPMLPHDRPQRRALEGSTVEIIDVTPNRPRLERPRPAYRPLVPPRDRVKVPELAR